MDCGKERHGTVRQAMSRFRGVWFRNGADWIGTSRLGAARLDLVSVRHSEVLYGRARQVKARWGRLSQCQVRLNKKTYKTLVRNGSLRTGTVMSGTLGFGGVLAGSGSVR